MKKLLLLLFIIWISASSFALNLGSKYPNGMFVAIGKVMTFHYYN